MVAFDLWAYEALTLLAGGLHSPIALADHIAVSNVYSWAYLMFRGVSKAATALVGAAVGKKELAEVARVLEVSFKVTLAICTVMVACCWIGRGQLALWLLNEDENSHEAFVSAFPYMLAEILIGGVNSLLSCVFAAFGRQGSVSLGLFICQWVVQLPAAWLLEYVAVLGVLGLWIASFSANALNMIYNGVLMRRSLQSLRKQFHGKPAYECEKTRGVKEMHGVVPVHCPVPPADKTSRWLNCEFWGLGLSLKV
ncbi:DTX34 [Symbiodinium natans]|uniref:DTX34 protein n=1 Tax=Symbiodinium natans TaxID=878477 RepID=A0A812N2F9_9DINO|nr:DTX34 [Symbiodinium natans]